MAPRNTRTAHPAMSQQIEAKLTERKIDYELRLYRAGDGLPSASAASSAAPAGKMNPAPSPKRS